MVTPSGHQASWYGSDTMEHIDFNGQKQEVCMQYVIGWTWCMIHFYWPVMHILFSQKKPIWNKQALLKCEVTIYAPFQYCVKIDSMSMQTAINMNKHLIHVFSKNVNGKQTQEYIISKNTLFQNSDMWCHLPLTMSNAGKTNA